jgi:rhamnulokinase
MVKNYFAVDLGATSGRTILAAFDGARVQMKEITRFPNPMIPLGGHLYWDIAGLYNEVLRGLREVAEKGIAIESIGIDTWGCDFAFFGKDGQLLGLPYCYRDSHTEGSQARFFKRMPAHEVYGRTGIQFMDFNSLFQLDTLKRNGCQALEHADKVLFIPDALIYMLTGEAVCEYTVASTSQMLNPMTGDLDEDILAALGLGREKFGEMTQPGTVVGTLSAQVQEATGLGAIPVVAVAGHDTGSAVAAVPAQDREYAYLSCGTWSLLGIESAQAIISEASLSYMGLGIQPPEASWGYLLKTAQQYMGRAPWLIILPGLMILLVVLALNFVGDGLREALDVRIKSD